MKRAQNHRPVFVVHSEFEFSPLNVMREYGYPNENDDFLRLLSIKTPSYELIDELDNRLDLLFDEIEFQVIRLTERSDSSVVKLTVSDTARSYAALVQAKSKVLPTTKGGKQFANAEDVEYKKNEPLPSGVDPIQVLKQVLFLSPLKHYFSKSVNFTKLLHSPFHASILSDIFWWIFLELFHKQRDDTAFLQTRLAITITRRLKDMQQRMEHHQKGVFFRYYPETLGKCIFIAFLECFPYQAQSFGYRFKYIVMSNLSKWTLTVLPPPQHLRNWDFVPLVSHTVLPIVQSVLRPSGDTAAFAYDAAALDLDISRLRKEDRKYSAETSRVVAPKPSRVATKFSTASRFSIRGFSSAT